ncbi:16S rRNA (guanine(966)-N(2))-methyltransferase RsmD [Paenalkalicoccus suaedae]|uniref:16S rRNA (Guanine(966)-N(2))-methyltransferase RsmD n=1 Tax=Paenalkalicoccus suaedae TaxID=2592382 RepID=A0A859FFU1_9BACI|nr:16S rRNA (guanine(966)-N(2))-methyltransferase RsmD [Paenalkalicoccus suaedae]QKS71542.1 16S rRNA (guanine(966)-N(2))-methyltransferase RsmD [Paenalkalicoccus suaedae]
MRVISGDRRGMQLKAVPGQSTRPTTDKVKESIFNMIGPYFDGGMMLDLYGGSGSIGIEAISRGMSHAILVDKDKKAIDTINANVKQARYEDEIDVYRNDSERALKAIVKKEHQFALIFLDPPYKNHRLDKELLFIAENKLLEKNGIIVVEHAFDEPLQEQYEELMCIREERYGDTMISLFEWKEQSE